MGRNRNVQREKEDSGEEEKEVKKKGLKRWEEGSGRESMCLEA